MESIVTEKFHSQVQVLSDLEALSHQAASLYVNASESSTAARNRFVVAISGGSTPRRLYALLGAEPYRGQVHWQHVHFFWADERCVSKEDEESNFKTAFDMLLSKVSISDENIHRVKGEEGPDKGARDYEEEIKMFFGKSAFPMFDLIILGMGEDGHTASLFPGSKALQETTRIAVPVYLEKPNRNRITLTLPVLNNAAQVLFLVAGDSKAKAVSEVLGDGEERKRYPAGLIRPVHGSMIWLIDQKAAGKLKRIKQ